MLQNPNAIKFQFLLWLIRTNQHFGSRVVHSDGFQNGCPIVGYCDGTFSATTQKDFVLRDNKMSANAERPQ